MSKIVNFIKSKGIRGTWDTIKLHYQTDIKYDSWFRKNQVTEEELIKQKNSELKYSPKISIIVPAFHTEIFMIKELINSVKNQSYSNWELCISVGCPEDDNLIRVLSQYSDSDKIKYTVSDQNLGISDNTNNAISLASGEYIALLDHDDIIESDALYEIAKVIQDKTVDMIYTDEDKVNSKLTKYCSPYFKPDFSIDLLRSQNYITHLLVIKNELLKKVGGLLSEMDGAQDYDFILRCVEKADKIVHLPKILYHWRMIKGSTSENPKSKMYCYEAGKMALENHLKRCNIDAEVVLAELLGRYHIRYKVVGSPLLSVVVVNSSPLQKMEIENSVMDIGGYANLEFVYVNNVDLSSAYNYGAQQAKGDFILFVSGYTVPIKNNSIYELLALCMQKEVGIVAPKVLYFNNTIKHAGMILGFKNRVGYAFRGCDKNATTYMNRAEQNCNYSVVSADVFMVSKDVFNKVGGYDGNIDLEINQIQFCKRILESKLRVVYNAFSEWRDENKNVNCHRKRLDDSEWKNIKKGDPYYNINLSMKKKLFELD